jgi:CRP-like cAMP-binding protein
MSRNGNPGKGVRCMECPWRSSDAFKPLSHEQVEFIDSLKREHVVRQAGAEIVRPGEENAELYTLFAGWAFRYQELPDGRRQILNFLLPGDLVGLQAALFEASQHGISALTRVELCVLPRRRFWSLFERMPELAFDVTWLGAREESYVDDNLTSVGRRNSGERIAALVIGLWKRLTALNLAKGDVFDFPLNQQHIADALGLSLVHTNKTLAKLRRMEMFSIANGRMTLKNPRVLERLSQSVDAEFVKRPLI